MFLLAVVLCLNGLGFPGGLSLEVGNMERDQVKDDRQLLQAVWDLFPLYHLDGAEASGGPTVKEDGSHCPHVQEEEGRGWSL